MNSSLPRKLSALASLLACLPGTLSAEPRLPDVELDLTNRDFDERRVELFPQLSDQLDRSEPRCDRLTDRITQYGCRIAESAPWPVPVTFAQQPEAEVTIRGSGLIELGLALAYPQDMDPAPYLVLNVSRGELGGSSTEHAMLGGAYRSVISSGLRTWSVRVETNAQLLSAQVERLRNDGWEREAYTLVGQVYSARLQAVARRIDGDCAMSAIVSGDIDRYVFGDTAYFNIAQVPVQKGMMVGTLGETQAHEQVAGFGTVGGPDSVQDALDMAASLGLIDEEERASAQESIDNASGGPQDRSGREAGEPGSEDFAEWAQRELRADNPSEGDNFGLNLVDLKRDVTPKNTAFAGAMLGGAFTLALSGRIDLGDFTTSPRENRWVRVTPSTLTATVGLSELGGDRIPFELSSDSGLEGRISIGGADDDFVFGQLEADLETPGVYNLEGVVRQGSGVVSRDEPRTLKIRVEADFAARRGSLSCMQ